MGKVKDPAALARFKEILSFWRYTGYVRWKRVAADWVDKELEGLAPRAIAELMWNHVDEVSQVVEDRPEFVAYRFHYDFRLPISGRRIYIETVLIEDDEPEETIFVVSIHDV
jgi:hypothetical protein